MNGDFLSLLPKSSFAPGAIPVAAGAGAAALEATTVFAFHCAAGVLVAGDHRATAGNVVFSDRTEKIIELDRHSLLAIAGSPAVAIEMARTLQTAFEFYRRSQFQPMSLPAKMRALSRLLHENAPAALQGFGLVSPIFAGHDAATGRPSIYFYDPLGAQFEAAAYAGSGSGSGSIKSVLHFLEKWGRPKPEEMPLGAGRLPGEPIAADRGGIRHGDRRSRPCRGRVCHRQAARFRRRAPNRAGRAGAILAGGGAVTEEPYRWLEAVANRREYIADQLKGATPVFAFSRPEGILLCGVGSGQSKVFEIYDRLALAALGHPVDIEKIRQSLIEAAHLEGFTRAPEDVTARRLLNFSLGPLLKGAFEQVFAAPLIVEGIFAEMGAAPAQDVLARFSFDGTHRFETGGIAVSNSVPEREAPAVSWLREQIREQSSLPEVVRAALAAWQALGASTGAFPDKIPTAPPDTGGRTIEVALLERAGYGRARYRQLDPPAWADHA